MHGGRSTADVQQPSSLVPASREKLVLSDWHMLALSASPALEVHASPLCTSSAVTQAQLQTCKHCLVAATAAQNGQQLPVVLCGGSRGLTTPRPCTMVAVDISNRRVTLADAARVAAVQAICPSLQQAMCCGQVDSSSGRGAAFLLPGSGPSREMSLCIAAISSDGVTEAGARRLSLPSHESSQPAWTALCVSAGAACGVSCSGGRALAIAQCVVGDRLAGVYAWFPDISNVWGKQNGEIRGVGGANGARQQRKLPLSPVDATARVQQARREAEARCGPVPLCSVGRRGSACMLAAFVRTVSWHEDAPVCLVSFW